VKILSEICLSTIYSPLHLEVIISGSELDSPCWRSVLESFLFISELPVSQAGVH